MPAPKNKHEGEKQENKVLIKIKVDTTELDKLLEKLKKAKSLADEIASLWSVLH